MVRELKTKSYLQELKELHMFSIQKGRVKENMIAVCLKDCYIKEGVNLFSIAL